MGRPNTSQRSTLCTRLSAAGLTLSPIQFYQHFLNSLPTEYDWVTAVHDPISSNYSIDTLCKRILAIELRRELHTTRDGGASEDPVALLAKQKGSRGSGRSESGRSGGINESAGNSRSSSKWKRPSITCFGCGKRGHYKRDCRSSIVLSFTVRTRGIRGLTWLH